MSQKDIATALALTEGRVSQLKKQGMPVTSLAQARRWYEANTDPSKRGRSPLTDDGLERGEETFDKARTRERIAIADQQEMEAAKMRGDLVPTEDVRRQWAVETSRQRESWLQLADRLAPLLEMRPLAFIRQTLDAEVRQILTGLSV